MEGGRRCLALLSDSAWLVQPRQDGDAAAVGIERSDGRVRGVVVLDVRHAQVVLKPVHGCSIDRWVALHLGGCPC